MGALMVQGTGSDVGKSLIVAGLCRAYAKRGLRVRPFKPQNMSNNAAVTQEGGEIGRAQALQAQSCGVQPSVHMNPVLLKPETMTGSQIIVQGRRAATMTARDYFKKREQFMPAILESFHHMNRQADLVLIEGAGSPAEVNLRQADLANMGFAHAANVPVIIVGDIHRGGVIASLIGTKTVLCPADAARIKAFLINNFHGQISLFDEGAALIEKRTGWFNAGIVPHFEPAQRLPAEDALTLNRAKPTPGRIKIAVPRLSRIANFDDLDPLRLEEDVSVVYVPAGEPLPADATLILLPGSKATMADMAFFIEQGWHIDLQAHLRRGGRVLGICAGYQMLGRKIHDEDGIEGPKGSVDGLGIIDIETRLTPRKSLKIQQAVHLASGKRLCGYEMHLGQSDGPDRAFPFAKVAERAEGVRLRDGLICGTYLHGIFNSDSFRRAFLYDLRHETGSAAGGTLNYSATIEETLDQLAEHVEQYVDLQRLLELTTRHNA